MKAKRLLGLILCVGLLSQSGWWRLRAADRGQATGLDVLKMKSVPDGHFLVNLRLEGKERFANILVKDDAARCVNSDDARLRDARGEFQLIGNGVFLVFFQSDRHRASQFWLFQKDGTAVVKEVPDRGEKQIAVPVADDSLALPKKQQ